MDKRKAPSIASLRPVIEIGAEKPHGTRLRYMSGCKCDDCRRANSQYECERAKARKNGHWNGIVSAKKARSHIKKLSKKGIGYKTVADVAGLAASTVFKIRQGERKFLRAENERKILAVDETCLADSAVVPANTVWNQLEWLFKNGFSEAEIAKELGYANGYLQFKDNVLASTALKVERLCNRIKAEKELEKSQKQIGDMSRCFTHAEKFGKTKAEAADCFDFSVGCLNCPFKKDFDFWENK